MDVFVWVCVTSAPIFEDKIVSKISKGPIAQWLEQRTHNPLVRGSNPCGPTLTITPATYQEIRGYRYNYLWNRYFAGDQQFPNVLNWMELIDIQKLFKS